MRYNLAVALYKGVRFGEAATELEAVLKAKPDHPAAPLLLADCRLLLGEWKQVIAILDPLLERDPDNKAILYMIGTALMRDRQYRARPARPRPHPAAGRLGGGAPRARDREP